MQGITGVNEKYRLKMAIADEGIFCVNSVNYLLCGDKIYYFLGLLNSRLLNWFFAKLSTNSNVNGYEVDNIPIKIADAEMRREVENSVQLLLANPDNKVAGQKLDALVYDIYGLMEKEREVVEQRYY